MLQPNITEQPSKHDQSVIPAQSLVRVHKRTQLDSDLGKHRPLKTRVRLEQIVPRNFQKILDGHVVSAVSLQIHARRPTLYQRPPSEPPRPGADLGVQYTITRRARGSLFRTRRPNSFCMQLLNA